MKFKTFTFPTMVSRINGKTQLSEDVKSINECLGILLRTRPGELLGDPEYGCNLLNRIYQYNGVIIEDLCKDDIIDAISKYETRCSVSKENIQIVRDTRYVYIYISYENVLTGNIEEFDMTVDGTPNTYTIDKYSKINS